MRTNVQSDEGDSKMTENASKIVRMQQIRLKAHLEGTK